LAAYDRLIATRPGVARKGAAVPYTSLNGHMTSYLTEAGSLVLRLPPGERARFLERYDTTLHRAYGLVQKEFVDVPDALLEDTDALRDWFAASLDGIGGLKPKTTTKGKKASNPTKAADPTKADEPTTKATKASKPTTTAGPER
jgi:hypothetical protein